MEFVPVPSGCFWMGSDLGDADERPVHKVCLDSFWMGKYVVTQGQYGHIMGINPSRFRSGDDYPVEGVRWSYVEEFISKFNQQSDKKFSLPTEAQWEYAARSGGKDQEYAGGDDVDKFAWYELNSGGSTHLVGTKAPNDLGIYGMSGNVFEWCRDVYDRSAYGKHERDNPLIVEGSAFRVFRGGNWSSCSSSVRATFRNAWSIGDYCSNTGFRLCFAGK
jgi:formylglycine-generating enzyme required for sulfatase activity